MNNFAKIIKAKKENSISKIEKLTKLNFKKDIKLKKYPFLMMKAQKNLQ